MHDPDEFIQDFLSHLYSAEDRPYDPVKAHEYYIRTRKLKGRKPGKKHMVGHANDHPQSKVDIHGKPLPRLGTRMEEDQTPNKSPYGAQLIDYNGNGKGKATYADGTVYDANKGWVRPTTKRQARVVAAQVRLDQLRNRIQALPAAKRQNYTKRLRNAERRLQAMSG